MFERIEFLLELGVDRALGDVDVLVVRRYARRRSARSPSVSARIREPVRSVEVACFLRQSLLSGTDHWILMVQRRVVDLWRHCAEGVRSPVDWAARYAALLDGVAHLSAAGVPAEELQTRLAELVIEERRQRRPSRAALIRQRLIDAIRPVRSLLQDITRLRWQAQGEHAVLQGLRQLRALYDVADHTLPTDTRADGLGRVWRPELASADRERAFRALEVATLFAWRRSVRSGAIWLEHSLAFRGRHRLLLAPERWQVEAPRHYARLSLPTQASEFLAPLLDRVRTGVNAVAAAARNGSLRVDDELHLSPLPAEDEAPELKEFRARLDRQIGDVQLPELILEVDARVRFSWIMLGREPRSAVELLMIYAGILAHGTSLTAAECARMIPQLSANSIRQAMRWAADERRLRLACQAVLDYMQSHPIAASWGRADLASSDMMSVETSRRVWQARLDPRRQTASVGVYSHVRDRWGIFHAQPVRRREQPQHRAVSPVPRRRRHVPRRLGRSRLSCATPKPRIPERIAPDKRLRRLASRSRERLL
jgi:hypothetical protein